jgi:hypothetical protein
MNIMRTSQLTNEDMELIWDHVDIGNKEALTKEEFRMMMILMRKRKNGFRIGSDMVSDWRLEQLKNRRKQEDNSETITKTPPPPRNKATHKSMMKELEPILIQRAQHLKEAPSSKHYEEEDEEGKDVETTLALMNSASWPQKSLDELMNLAKQFEDAIMAHKRAENKLERLLIGQQEEIRVLEESKKAFESVGKKASSTPNNDTDRLAQLQKQISHIENDLNQFYVNVHFE